VETVATSGGTSVSFTVTVSCVGYIRDGETVDTSWSYTYQLVDMLGRDESGGDSNVRRIAPFNQVSFTVAAKNFSCDTTPGNITTLTVQSYVSNAFGSDDDDDIAFCN